MKVNFSMSGTTEVKHALRKLEYPFCAKEALVKIEQLLAICSGNIKLMDLVMDLTAEFVFCEVDRRGNRRTPPLTALQELQLAQLLVEYLGGTPEASRHAVFLSLFGGTALPLRVKALSRLVSLAVCAGARGALAGAALWMQQMGATSPHSLQLANALLTDFFVYTPAAVGRLRALPVAAPHFTANFLTALAEIHLADKRTMFTPPPLNLLQMIVDWVSEKGRLCMSVQGPVGGGGGALGGVPAVCGLLKWSILAPLHRSSVAEQGARLYAKLHGALLEALVATGGSRPALCAQHLAAALPPILTHVAHLMHAGRAPRNDLTLQISLERLAQAVQIALSSRTMFGNIQDLLNQLEQLPDNRLLKIVINTNKQIIL